MKPGDDVRSAILEVHPQGKEVRLRQYCRANPDNPGVLAERLFKVQWGPFAAARHLGVVVELGMLRPTHIREYVLSLHHEKILARYQKQESAPSGAK